MKLFATLTHYLREPWARKKTEPPYPLTYDEMVYFEQQCPQQASERAFSWQTDQLLAERQLLIAITAGANPLPTHVQLS